MSKKIFKTVVYCRLSREDGDKLESNSIGGQRAYCEEYVSKQSDMRIVREAIVDDGFSGVSFERPGFRILEGEILKGNIDCIVVRDLSRFSRDYIGAGQYLEKTFPELGVRFIAINDNYDSFTGNTASDSFMIPFKNLINDMYCKDISVKIRSSLSIKRKNGEFVGAFCPYGYTRAFDNRHQLIPDETAKEIVQMIFTLFKDGFSIDKIVKRLNGAGIPSPLEHKIKNGVKIETAFKTGKTAKWSYTAVRRILTNDVYIGMLSQGKRSTPNHKVRVVMDVPESNWVRYENAHEALVSYEDFTAIAEMLKRDMHSSKEGINIFSGFLFCADCGATMIRKTVPSKGKKYLYHICSANKKRGECSSHSISAKEIYEKVMNALHTQIELVADIQKILSLTSELSKKDQIVWSIETQIGKLNEEIDRYQKLKLRLYEDFRNDIISREEYFDFRDNYSNILDEKILIKERLEKECERTVSTGITSNHWVTIFQENENIETLDRRVLMSLVDRILIHENHCIEIVFKYKDEYTQTMEYLGHLSDTKEKVAEKSS